MQKTHTILDKILFISVLFVLLAGCSSSGGGAGNELDTEADTAKTVTCGDPVDVGTNTVSPASTIASTIVLDGLLLLQVIKEGIPQRQMKLSFVFESDLVELCRQDGATIEVNYEDPVSGATKTRVIPISNVELDTDSRRITVTVEGPVSEGSALTLAPGTVIIRDDNKFLRAEPIILYGPNGSNNKPTISYPLLSEKDATLWLKPFTLTDLSFVSTPKSPGVGIPQPTDPQIVEQNLRIQLQSLVDKGQLTPNELEASIVRFNDPEQRKVFTDPNTGEFQPHLMAGLLALKGTPASSAIEAALDGNNMTGQPMPSLCMMILAPLDEGHLLESLPMAV